ncbi:MAG: hypothetical protein JO020_10150 [Chloroflexi bacterium]|nr:hypothetical protein [Chloroflexota bacterium]
MRPAHTLLALVLVLSLFVTACGAGTGAPSSPGTYPVQQGSVHFDGDRYQLYWADSGGNLHHMDTRSLRLMQDPNSTFLEVPQSGDPILHLRQDEPITVESQDRQGAFGSPWFPFLLGATLGNTFGGGRGGGQTVIINNPAPGETRTYDPSTPTYRYPPTGSVGRDDELHGSLDSSKPQTPDYSKVQPAPYATTAKSSGTGGGNAVTNKTSGSGVGAGSKGVLPSGATSKPSTSSGSGSKGIGGARAGSGGRH